MINENVPPQTYSSESFPGTKESESSDTRANHERGQGFVKSVDCRHIQKTDRNKQ